jgi:hypothetical protein
MTAEHVHFEQLQVKLVRLLANLSISAEVGPLVAEMDDVSVLLSILDGSPGEELLLNAVSALT